MPSYRTVGVCEPAEIEVKRSRFICYVGHVTTRDEADAFVAAIRTQHRESTHAVFAYLVREDHYCRFSDDGEPSGTAGKPVLDVLRGSGLVDVCVVVVRYFGGTLLGTGGLVRAYSDSARAGLLAAQKLQMTEVSLFTARFDYSYYGKITALISEQDGKIEQSTFADAVDLSFSVPSERADAFLAALSETTFGRVSATPNGFGYRAEDVL